MAGGALGAGPRRWPAGLAWALWALTLLGPAATVWLDRLLRQAGRAELAALSPSGVPLAVAAVSAVTVGAVLAVVDQTMQPTQAWLWQRPPPEPAGR